MIFSKEFIDSSKNTLDKLFFNISILENSIKIKRLEAKYNLLLDFLDQANLTQLVIPKLSMQVEIAADMDIQVMEDISTKIALFTKDIHETRIRLMNKDFESEQEVEDRLDQLRAHSKSIFNYVYSNMIDKNKED